MGTFIITYSLLQIIPTGKGCYKKFKYGRNMTNPGINGLPVFHFSPYLPENTSKYHAGTLICKSPCNASCNTSATSQQHNPIFHSSQMLLNNIFGQISYFHPFGRYFLVPSSISLTSCLMSCSLHFLPLTWGSFIKARTTSSSLQVRAASSMVS